MEFLEHYLKIGFKDKDPNSFLYTHTKVHLSQTANVEFTHWSCWQHPAHLELK